MEQPLVLQANQFLWSAVLGVGFGIYYDFLLGLRRNLHFLTHLLDFFFVITVLAGNLLFGLYLGNGQYRIFMLLGSALGIAIYFLTLSRPMRWAFTKFWSIFTFPLRCLGRLCKKILEKIKKFAKNIFSTVKKSVKIKKHKTISQGGTHDAPAQIVTHYQAHHTGGHGVRNRDHRSAATKNQRA